jgi:hypothetical protein
LALPQNLRKELMQELNKARSEQRLTVDQVIEAVDGASRLEKAKIIDEDERNDLVVTIAAKFRDKVLKSTVEPRKLSRIARAVERKEITRAKVRSELQRFVNSPHRTINQIFEKTVENADFSHGTEQLVRRSLARLKEIQERDIELTAELRAALDELLTQVRAMLR